MLLMSLEDNDAFSVVRQWVSVTKTTCMSVTGEGFCCWLQSEECWMTSKLGSSKKVTSRASHVDQPTLSSSSEQRSTESVYCTRINRTKKRRNKQKRVMETKRIQSSINNLKLVYNKMYVHSKWPGPSREVKIWLGDELTGADKTVLTQANFRFSF